LVGFLGGVLAPEVSLISGGAGAGTVAGQGKCRELDTKCTVFKRAPDNKYNLKMKSAREVSDV
jgi:hypothetical protein